MRDEKALLARGGILGEFDEHVEMLGHQLRRALGVAVLDVAGVQPVEQHDALHAVIMLGLAKNGTHGAVTRAPRGQGDRAQLGPDLLLRLRQHGAERLGVLERLAVRRGPGAQLYGDGRGATVPHRRDLGQPVAAVEVNEQRHRPVAFQVLGHKQRADGQLGPFALRHLFHKARVAADLLLRRLAERARRQSDHQHQTSCNPRHGCSLAHSLPPQVVASPAAQVK